MIIIYLIYQLCWHYKIQAKYAPTVEARKLEQRKSNVYEKWRALGLSV